MTLFHQWQGELFVDTPKGEALVLGFSDRGVNSDIEWLCVVLETGEIWSVKNFDVRVAKNWTMGIRKEEFGSKNSLPLTHGQMLYCGSCAQTIFVAPGGLLPDGFKCDKSICPVMDGAKCVECGVPYGAHHYGNCETKRWSYDAKVTAHARS